MRLFIKQIIWRHKSRKLLDQCLSATACFYKFESECSCLKLFPRSVDRISLQESFE